MSIDNETKKVSQITDVELRTMKNLSAYALPNNPSNSGMKAPQVKPKFYDFALGKSTSLYTILVRTINEINAILETYKGNFDLTKEHLETVSGNPHEVTAEETGAYTKEAVNELLVELENEIRAVLAEIISGEQVVGNAKNVTTSIGGVDLQNIFLMDDTYVYENDGKPTVHYALSDKDGNIIHVTYAKKTDLNDYIRKDGALLNADFIFQSGEITFGRNADLYLDNGFMLNQGDVKISATIDNERLVVNGYKVAHLNDIPTDHIPTSQKGTANGVATLDANCKIPSSQLPSFVDDVLEYQIESEFPTTGESGKIYLATQNNKSYRWGGSQYVEISSSIALGETSSTAYAGDKGKANADAIKDLQENKVDKDEAFLRAEGQEVDTSFEVATSDKIDVESETQIPTSKAVQIMIENSLGDIESLLEVI